MTGVHCIVYTRDAEAARTFFRDVLDLPCIDAGQGWLVFYGAAAVRARRPSSRG